MIRYAYHENEFIYEIEIFKNKHNENDETYLSECKDTENAIYKAERYIIRNIIHCPTKITQKGYSLDYCDMLYKNPICYYKTYERALSEVPFDLLVKKNAVLRDDFPNVFRIYFQDGSIHSEFFHINGIIEGIYKSYDSDSNILCECPFVNGKIHGICKVYNYDECNACGEINCEQKKDVYEYPFENGNRLYMDDFYMARDLDFIIPYYLQTK